MSEAADFVFDLDGTISDPLVGIHRSFNYALTSLGFDEVSEVAVAKLIGPPLDEGFRDLLPGTEDQLIHALVAKYRERYAEVGYAENAIYDGVVDALAEMAGRGARLGLCTSKRVDFAEKILALFEVREHFAFVDGGDIGISKAQQLEALASAGLVSTRSTMIGDRAVDVLAAHANGLSSVGVLWGYGSAEELTDAGAGALVRDAGELSRI